MVRLVLGLDRTDGVDEGLELVARQTELELAVTRSVIVVTVAAVHLLSELLGKGRAVAMRHDRTGRCRDVGVGRC